MTGHFTSYENRTDHELATGCSQDVAAVIGLVDVWSPSKGRYQGWRSM